MPDIIVTFLGTGAGVSVQRAHTAIVIDCADGTRLLLDASSGNSVLRHGAALGMLAIQFDQVLLTHHHADHMGGITFLSTQRRRIDPQGPPLNVFSTEEALHGLGRMCRATQPNLGRLDQEGGWTLGGDQLYRWNPVGSGQWQSLGPSTRACTFPVDHIPGAVGWKVESDGITVVFSGDTRFCSNVAEAAKGADLLIHEAFCTDRDRELAGNRGHSTSGEAGRTAAQAGVAELVLTHIDTLFHYDTQPLIDDAKQHYDGPVSVASDLHQITVAAG